MGRTPQASISCLILLAAIVIASCSNRSDDGAGRSATREPAEGPRLIDEFGADGCPHKLQPFVEGAHWSYKIGTPEGSKTIIGEFEVLKIETIGRSQKVEVKRSIGPIETTEHILCNAEGVSFLSLFVPLGPPLPASFNFSPRVTERTGALIPPMRQLKSGAQWSYELVAHTERPGGKALTLDSIWSVEGQYLGKREVTVAAGRYQTIQLRFHVKGHHRPPEEEDVVLTERMMDPPPMTFTYSLAEGVGVVLIEGEPPPDRPDQRARWELTKIHREPNSR